MRSSLAQLALALVLQSAAALAGEAGGQAEVDPAWVAEAEGTAADIKRAVIDGVAGGRKERVYVEFGASLVKGEVVRATKTEIEVKTRMASISLPWERLSPKRLYFIGLRYLPEDDARVRLKLARFCIAHGLTDEARKELDEAYRLGPEIRGRVQAAIDFLDGRRLAKLRKTAQSALAGTKSGEGSRKAPPKTAVPVGEKVARVLRKLGRRHFMLGVASRPGDTWIGETSAAGSRWDMRYQYLAGGVNGPKNWKEWNSPPGAFVTRYLNGSERMGVIPVFSWYQMYQSLPGGGGGEAQVNRTNCASVSTMRQYLSDIRLFMEKAAEFGKPVVLHVEPDLWGYFLIAGEFRPDDPDTIRVMVKSTGLADVAEFDDTMAGFGRAIVALRDRYAPNVILGWHASKWGSPAARKYADAIEKCGDWDVIFVDPSDRDAGWKLAHGYHVHGAWWKESDFESFERWCGELHKLTGLPIISWQIPVGNTIMAACNNTEGHYMDNRVQTWLGDCPTNVAVTRLAKQGFIALLFGGGAGGCTGFGDGRRDGTTNPPPVEGNEGRQSRFPDDDGGYLRLQSAAYYTNPVLFHWRE